MSHQTKERRPPTFYGDISPRDVLSQSLIIVMVLYAAFVFFGCVGFANQGDYEEIKQYNQKVEAFNKLPSDERKKIKELVSGLTSDLTWQEEDKTVLKAKNDPISMVSILGVVSVIICGLIPIVVFVVYYLERSSAYYLADFPLRTVYGWILLLLCLPIGWPFFIVSRIRMLRHTPKRAMEEAGAQSDENETSDELLEEATKNRSTNEEEEYVKLRVTLFKEQRERMIQELDDDIVGCEKSIRYHGVQIQEQQKKLGEKRAQRQQLKDEPITIDDRTALAELVQIRKMRGVKEIISDLDNERLIIVVHVRVPYEGAMYDFGDYEIRLSYQDSSAYALRLRSGVKQNATSEDPFYKDGDYFCFGDRLSEIEQYFVDEGRVIEALTLMIDCMHSVNPEDKKEIPNCFTRLSKPKTNLQTKSKKKRRRKK